MTQHKRAHPRRNLFEIENARNLTTDEMVKTFVPTKAFWRLLSAKNHIVLGSRGSGKTALAKMLSHEHLSQLNEERAQEVIKSKSLIGIYVPTRIEWVGGLKNKSWQTERQKEEFFQWRLNIATCLSFLVTVQSCLNTYIDDKLEKAKTEEEIALGLSQSWFEGTISCRTINLLQNYLEDIEHLKQQQLARKRVTGKLKDDEDPAGISFETDLFTPVRRGITLVTRVLKLPKECIWLLCLDEAEFLETMHHRILNTYMRSYSGNLAFKITTMPYSHYTLETNTGVPLNVGQDFEYVYIDQDPILGQQNFEKEESFADTIFRKRAAVSPDKFHRITLRKLLGPSSILEEKSSYWSSRSKEMKLLLKYGDSHTVNRAKKLSKSRQEFADQISRKMHGALLLREAVSDTKGRSENDIYSGDSMIIRCSDANPRRLIRIYNSLLLEAKWKRNNNSVIGVKKLSPKEQSRILTNFSSSALSRIQSEPEIGPDLHDFLLRVGKYMHFCLHKKRLSTDQVSSIRVDKSISEYHWKIIKRAIELGLLYPNKNIRNPDHLPNHEGTFHLAYVLAPRFELLPRKGKSVALSTIFTFDIEKADENQLPLGFDNKAGEE